MTNIELQYVDANKSVCYVAFYSFNVLFIPLPRRDLFIHRRQSVKSLFYFFISEGKVTELACDLRGLPSLLQILLGHVYLERTFGGIAIRASSRHPKA